MKLNKLPFPHLPKGAGNDGEGKAAWRIGAFFLLMLALTLFSRGMAGAALTTVTTQTPAAATAAETLTLTGTVESQSVEVLTPPDGLCPQGALPALRASLTVQAVLVTEGQTVKEEDGLVQVDTDTVDQALTQAQGELDKLNLQMAAYQEEQEADDSAVTSAQTAYDRAKEDAASEASAQSTQVSRAKAAVSAAKSDLSDAKSELKSLKSQRSDLKTTISEEKAELSDLKNQLTEEENAGTGDTSAAGETAAAQELQNQIEAMEAQIAADEASLSSYDDQITAAQEAVESAQQTLDSAQEALEDANTAASDSKRSSQRSLEDAETALSAAQDDLAEAQADADTQNQQNQAEALILSVTIAQQEEVVTTLAALQENGGVLTAPCDGKIVSLTGAAGDSSELVEVHLTAQSDSYVLTLTGSELEQVPDGAALQVTQADTEGTVTLAALTQDSETGTLTGAAYLTGDWADGSATVSVTLSSERYDLTIPIGAYHEDNAGGFVFVVEEVESVLGLRYQIRREAVTLLASNGELAAVDGILSSGSQVVIGSSRSIEDGEYVRMCG